MDGLPQPHRAAGAADFAVRIGFPSSRQLSGQPWVGERAAALLPILERRIRELCEPFSLLATFLGGSAVHAELCGIAEPGGRRLFLSDLDLGVLTLRRLPASEMDRIKKEIQSLVEDGPPAGIGFYCREDLERQHPTPGLVETVRLGFVLYGDASWLGRMRMPSPERIPPWEARRLLANRALEWLAARQERGAVPAGVLYAAAKLHADAGTAYLVATGAYPGGGYRDRLMQLRGAELPPSCRSTIEAWSAWRLEPVWARVPGGGDVLAVAASATLDESVAETTIAVVQAVTGSESVERFLGARRVLGRTWARSWRRWLRGGRPPALRIGGRGWSRTPRLLLWEAALECAMGHRERAIETIGSLRRGAPDQQAEPEREIVSMAALMDREGVE